MRIHLIFLLVINSFCCSAQTLFKSIYDPTGGFLYYAFVIQNRDSTYNVFTKNYGLISMQMDNSGNILWTKSIDATGIKLDKDLGIDKISDSTFIIVSSCYYTEYGYDIYLAKVNKAGQAIWIKSIGNSHTTEYGHNVKCTEDGGFIIAGEKWIGSVDPAMVFIVKTDSNGNMRWSKAFDRERMDAAYDVVETEDGFITAGSTNSLTYNGSLGLLIKTDKAGNTIWIKGYGTPLSVVKSIIKDGNFFLLAGGSVDNPTLGSIPIGDAVLLKTDSVGNPVWTKQYHFDDKANAINIIKTIDGGYLLLGMLGHLSSLSENRCFFIKTDSLGNMQWCKKYGGQAQGYWGKSLLQNPNGDLISLVEYYTTTDVLMLFKTDSLGNASGVCEESTNPTVYSPTILDSNLVFAETFYYDTAIAVPFSISRDSLVAVDSCNIRPLSIQDISNFFINIYPNPSTGVINIESALSSYEIEITNTFGAKVFFKKVNTNKAIIDLTQYGRGFYACSIKTHDKVVKTQGFILR